MDMVRARFSPYRPGQAPGGSNHSNLGPRYANPRAKEALAMTMTGCFLLALAALAAPLAALAALVNLILEALR